MLEANLKTQLKGYLERLTQPVEIIASVDDNDKSREMLELLNDITSLSPLVTLDPVHDETQVKPSFALRRPGQATRSSRRFVLIEQLEPIVRLSVRGDVRPGRGQHTRSGDRLGIIFLGVLRNLCKEPGDLLPCYPEQQAKTGEPVAVETLGETSQQMVLLVSRDSIDDQLVSSDTDGE